MVMTNENFRILYMWCECEYVRYGVDVLKYDTYFEAVAVH